MSIVKIIILNNRWKDWKLIYGTVASAVVADEAELWIRPPENQNLAVITGDTCMKPDGKGGLFARCLFNLKGNENRSQSLHHK